MSKLFIEISKKQINKKINNEQEEKSQFYKDLKKINHLIIHKTSISMYVWMFYIPGNKNIYKLVNEIGEIKVNTCKPEYKDGYYTSKINNWYIQSKSNEIKSNINNCYIQSESNEIKSNIKSNIKEIIFDKKFDLEIINYIKEASKCKDKTNSLIKTITSILKCNGTSEIKEFCDKCNMRNCNSDPNFMNYELVSWFISKDLIININKINYEISLIIDDKVKIVTDSKLIKFLKTNKKVIKDEFVMKRDTNIKIQKTEKYLTKLKNEKNLLQRKSAIIIQSAWKKYKGIISDDCTRKVNSKPKKKVNLFVNKTSRQLYEEQSCKKIIDKFEWEDL